MQPAATTPALNTLFLAWQDKRPMEQGGTRRWFPIGRLRADRQAHRFYFDYVKGMQQAREVAGFQPLNAFPDVERHYVSSELFPLFQNRLMRREREDYPAYVERLGLEQGHQDPFEILAVSGGIRQTDTLEVFPKIEKADDGSFSCRFFLHGWRHVNEGARERILALRRGDALQVALELNNPATGPAIQLQTANDYFMLGWTPRYLVMDLIKAIGAGPTDIKAEVLRLNAPPAPYNQRLLVQMTGSFPAGVEPMASMEFQPIHA